MSSPIDFRHANKTLGKPVGWTDEECKPLPVWTDGNQCVSCWKLTWRERLSALFLGKTWLVVVSGYTQPPVYVTAAKEYLKDVS